MSSTSSSAELQWIQLQPQSIVRPRARDGHSAVVIGSKLLVFGGVCEPEVRHDTDDDDDDDDDGIITKEVNGDGGDEDDGPDDGQDPLTELNDLWAFDFGAASWTKLTAKGNIPTPRTGSVMFVSGNATDHVWLFGGFSSTSGWMSDLFKLSILPNGDYDWERVDAQGDAPTCRDKVSLATGADGRTWLFGGFGPLVDEPGDDGFGDGQTYKWFDDLFLFESGTFTRITATGVAPRCAAGAAVVGDQLYVFGGSFSSDPSKRSDALLSLALLPREAPLAWSTVSASGAPSGRSFVSAVHLNGRFVVFGGKSRGNTPLADGGVYRDGAWSSLATTSSDRPQARQYAQLVQRDATNALLFGGSGVSRDGEEMRFNDLWLLRLLTN